MPQFPLPLNDKKPGGCPLAGFLLEKNKLSDFRILSGCNVFYSHKRGGRVTACP